MDQTQFYQRIKDELTPNDNAYMEQIEQYKGTPYYEQLANNPWLYSKNAAFSPTFLQGLSESLLGDTSARDAYYGDLKNKQNQFLSEVLNAQHQEEYNSAGAQMQRERAAGLNPDLNGGSGIDAGAAADNDQPFSESPTSMFGSSDSVKEVGSIILQAVSFGQSFVSGLQALGTQEIDMATKLQPIVSDYLDNNVSPWTYDEDTKQWLAPQFDESVLDDFSRKHFRSSRIRRAFKMQVHHNFGSAKQYARNFGFGLDASGKLRETGNELSLRQTLGSLAPRDVEPIVLIANELNEMAVEVQKYNAKFDRDYAKEKSTHGKDFAESEVETTKLNTAQAKAQEKQAHIDEIVNSSLERIFKMLEDQSKKGGISGAICSGALLFFSAMRLNMLPSLPSVNVTDKRGSTSIFQMAPKE